MGCQYYYYIASRKIEAHEKLIELFMIKKRSFFERLTGGIRLEDDEPVVENKNTTQGYNQNANIGKTENKTVNITPKADGKFSTPAPEKEIPVEEGQLTVDVYQTPSEIVVQTMVAAVRPEDLQISITRDVVTIRGKREENKTITADNFFIKELYWGTFSRTILLPQEVEPDMAEAIEKHGLLIIKLPKIDKSKQATLRVKSL